MTLETRVKNLENLVDALSKKIDRNQFYTDADVNGNRQSITTTDGNIEQNTADIEYIAMMTDVDLEEGE
jgi:hypothetical protein